MPTYGYECLSCANQFEIFQSIKDDALTTCDSCGGILRKRIYPVGIAFKGSGFYVNDYSAKPSGGGDSAASESKSEPKSDVNSDTKTETKSETKTETKSELAKTEPKSETKAEAKAPVASAS